MSRLGRIVGLVLVAAGVVMAVRRPPEQPAPRGRVLVLLDTASASNADVARVFVDPGPPATSDGAETVVRESPFERWGVPQVADIATQAEHFDAVVAVTDGMRAFETAVVAESARQLTARGVAVHVVLTPAPARTDAPVPPAAQPRDLPLPLRPARTVRVLYVEQAPRWEYHFLTTAMCRDPDLLVHTWLADSDPETPQRRTPREDWPKIDLAAGLPSAAALDDYDVLVLGDVEPDALRGGDSPARDVAAEIRAWAESGHGLLVVAGPQRMPSGWTSTALMGVLPIVPVEPGPRRDPSSGFHLALTPDGAAHPVLDIVADAAESRRMWETRDDWTMYWAYPAAAVDGATTLARVGDDPRIAAIATRTCGRGRVLYVGIDEMWRTRNMVGDKWFWRFYGAAIAWLAEPRAGVVAAPKPAPAPAAAPPAPAEPPGAAALRSLAETTGGRTCGPSDAANLVTSLRDLRGPAPPAPERDSWTVAAGVAVSLCGAFFLLRGRAT